MSKVGQSSLWRSLVVALGEGVAFSVGVKITEGVARQLGRADPGTAALAGRVAKVEQRLEAAGGPPPSAELGAEAASAATRKYLDEKIEALRAQLVAVNRGFAEAVAAIVREEVQRAVEARATVLEKSLTGALRQMVQAQAAAAADQTGHQV